MRAVSSQPPAPTDETSSVFPAFFWRWRMQLIGVLFAAITLMLGWFALNTADQVVRNYANETVQTALLRKAQDVLRFRDFYSTQVMGRAQAAGVRITHDYRHSPNSLPTPSTLVIELSQFLGGLEEDTQITYFSDQPFPWRQPAPALDEFQREALGQLRANPMQSFFQEEVHNGRPVLRFAMADVMQDSCVNCHNSYKGSPQSHWKVGDLGGVLEISMPLEHVRNSTGELVNQAFLFLTSIGIVALGMFWVAMRQSLRNLQTAKQLAEKFQASNVALRTEVQQRATMEQGLRESQQALLSAKAKADSANELKSQFLANMSHEIRTPMNGLVGMTQLALQTQLTDEQREYLLLANASATHLLSVINDILDFSKIEAGHMTLEVTRAHPVDLLHQTLRTFQADALRKGLHLSHTQSPDVPEEVLTDPVRLRQVLTNLVGNAIKFTQQGFVQVHLSSSPGALPGEVVLHFSVRDSGIGFEPSQAEALFDPFIQGDNSITRSFGGTGLGLAITRNLVRLMGGEIHAHGLPNQGAVFDFTVQARVAPLLPTPVVPAPAAPRTHPRSLHILVAEDHPINQKLATLLLDRMGHTYAVAADGQEVLNWQDKAHFDLVLMDVMMPVMDGLTALQKWRAHESAQGTRTPVIMVTAHALTGDRERFLAAGADGYVAKPIAVEALYAEIARLVFA